MTRRLSTPRGGVNQLPLQGYLPSRFDGRIEGPGRSFPLLRVASGALSINPAAGPTGPTKNKAGYFSGNHW